jgi:hypothetical protein
MPKNSNHAVASLALLALSACAAPIVRIEQPDFREGAPAIDRLVDLGGWPLPASGQLSQEDSDGVLTPGEWVAVLGHGLDAGSKSSLTIDGTAVAVRGHLQGGSLLVQVPRKLAPRRAHQLAVTTPSGTASIEFHVRSYVVVGDTDGKTVRFLPMEFDGKAMISKSAVDLELNGAHLHTLSPSGAWLYILQETGLLGQSGPVTADIAVVHMGARKRPRMIGSFSVRSVSPPTALTMVDENTLLVLGENDLLVCEVTAGRIVPSASVPLPRSPGKSLYVDVLPLPGRSAAVVLEAYSNAVTLIDLSDLHQPRVVNTLSAGETNDIPWSVNLTPDLDDPTGFWLLQGPNLRISGEKLGRFADRLAAKTKAALGMKTSAPAPTAAPGNKPTDADQNKGARLVHLRAVAGFLEIERDDERALPDDFLPFYVLSQPKGEFLVSGVSSDIFRFAGIPRSFDGVKTVVDVLANSLQFGRVLRLRKAGPDEWTLKGPTLYFNLDTLADGTMVYSTIQPGVSVLPPSLEVQWGVDATGPSATGRDFRDLNALEWTALLPPYTFGLLSVQ